MNKSNHLTFLNNRSHAIFNQIVTSYLETGSPVGSAKISQSRGGDYSSATIRSIMAELENAGLLYQPHISAGRIPTHAGLRLFVDGLMEMRGELTKEEQLSIDDAAEAKGLSVSQVLDNATHALSGLSKCVSLVVSPTEELTVNHIEFIEVGGQKLLVILVFSNGHVENRLISKPDLVLSSSLQEATNYMNHYYRGKSITEINTHLLQDLAQHSSKIDSLSSQLVANGIAAWSDGKGGRDASLILHGQSNLLADVKTKSDIDQLRNLFDVIELRKQMQELVEEVSSAQRLQIYIGSEHPLFEQTGCSMVLSPYRDIKHNIIGAIGVIGPRNMNYAKIIPMVDYTSEAISRFLE